MSRITIREQNTSMSISSEKNSDLVWLIDFQEWLIDFQEWLIEWMIFKNDWLNE